MKPQTESRIPSKLVMVLAGASLIVCLGGCESGRTLVAVPFDVAKFVAVKAVEIPYDAAKMTAQGMYNAAAEIGR